MPILNKLFQKIEKEGNFHNSFYEINITLITKPKKDIHSKEDYRPISFRNINTKKSWINISKSNPAIPRTVSIKKCKLSLIFENQSMNHRINRFKQKNLTMISTDAGKFIWQNSTIHDKKNYQQRVRKNKRELSQFDKQYSYS